MIHTLVEAGGTGADSSTQEIDNFRMLRIGDGMPDVWEAANGLDTSRDDSFEDPDGDGILNWFELLFCLDPLSPDLLPVEVAKAPDGDVTLTFIKKAGIWGYAIETSSFNHPMSTDLHTL